MHILEHFKASSWKSGKLLLYESLLSLYALDEVAHAEAEFYRNTVPRMVKHGEMHIEQW
jgi:hypothetical protein